MTVNTLSSSPHPGRHVSKSFGKRSFRELLAVLHEKLMRERTMLSRMWDVNNPILVDHNSRLIIERSIGKISGIELSIALTQSAFFETFPDERNTF